MNPSLIKENNRLSTCNWLGLQTLGSQPLMPKNLPDYCSCIQCTLMPHRIPLLPFTLVCTLYERVQPPGLQPAVATKL